MSLRWKVLICAAAVAGIALAGCRKSENAKGVSPERQAAEATLHPPFGFIDVPKENDTVAVGSWAYGWALDDSGVAKVTVALDGGPAIPAGYGQFFPGVKEAYPSFLNSDKAGFGFSIPTAAPGPHLLIVTITANDGGRTELKRHIQIK